MARGGKRPGAGRPKGPAADRFIRAALKKAGYSEEGLWDKAIEVAMDGNTMMLKALLDKVAPNLKAVDTVVDVVDDFKMTLQMALDAAEGTGLTGTK